MDFWSIATIVVLMAGAFFCWCVYGFLRYKKQEASFKREIHGYFEEGTSFEESLRKSFSEVNQKYNLGLNEYTIVYVVQEISALLNKMTRENVIEIYSMFLNWYVYGMKADNAPRGVKDERILYAVSNLRLKERNGYFALAHDPLDEFSKKYPARRKLSIIEWYERVPEWLRWILFLPLSLGFSFGAVCLMRQVNFFSDIIRMVVFIFALHELVPRFKNYFVIGSIILRMVISIIMFSMVAFRETLDWRIWLEICGIELAVWGVLWGYYFWSLRKIE